MPNIAEGKLVFNVMFLYNPMWQNKFLMWYLSI